MVTSSSWDLLPAKAARKAAAEAFANHRRSPIAGVPQTMSAGEVPVAINPAITGAGRHDDQCGCDGNSKTDSDRDARAGQQSPASQNQTCQNLFHFLRASCPGIMQEACQTEN